MRPSHLQQVARVAIVVPPAARLASVGALLDGFEMTRAHIRQQYGAIDVLPAADRFDVADVHLLALGPVPVRTEGGTAITAAPLALRAQFDVVAIADRTPVPALLPTRVAEEFAHWLVRQHAAGAIIAASGASVEFLLECGLASGRRLAAPAWYALELRQHWPAAALELDGEVVEDGSIMSARGGVADQELALRLVEAVTSRNVGRWLAARLGLAAGSGGVANGSGALLEQAQEWLANRFSQSVRIDDLAAELGVDRRTIHRHFVSATGAGPAAYLQSLRLEAAKRMLERSTFRIERIAALVGYADSASFREAFRQRTGISPRGWRRRMQPSPL